MTDEEAMQSELLEAVDRMHLQIAGRSEALAETAVSLLVASLIIAQCHSERERHALAAGFCHSVHAMISRPDIVRWVQGLIVRSTELH